MPTKDVDDIKVVLLGSSYAGKTCFVKRFIHGCFHGTTETTIGAAFVSKKIDALGRKLTLNIWDTAGSERYQSMTKMYYRSARAAILCYDLTDKSSFDKLRYWIGELQENEQYCKLYICGTKKDLIDASPSQRAVSSSEAEVMAQDLQTDYFETSSLTGENVDAVFQKIGEDYMRNFSNYPENKQQTTADENNQSFHLKDNHRTDSNQSCVCFKR